MCLWRVKRYFVVYCLTWKTGVYFGVYFWFCLVFELQMLFFTLKNIIMIPRKLFPPEKVSLPYLHA